MSIYQNTQSILGHTRVSGTRVRQTRVNNSYIHTLTDEFSLYLGRCHDQCGAAQAHPNYIAFLTYHGAYPEIKAHAC